MAMSKVSVDMFLVLEPSPVVAKTSMTLPGWWSWQQTGKVKTWKVNICKITMRVLDFYLLGL